MPTEKLRREWLPVKPAEPSAVTTLSQSYGCQLRQREHIYAHQ